MNIESLQRMQTLEQVLEAARRRNGFAAAQSKTATPVKTLTPARAYATTARSTARPTPTPGIVEEAKPQPGRPVKTLGRNIDVMA